MCLDSQDADPTLLEQALAMSMAETCLAESGGNDDQDLALGRKSLKSY